MKRWLAAWGPAAIWAAVLFLLSSRTTVPVDLTSGRDKVAHFAAYLVLGYLLAHGGCRLARPLPIAVVLGLLYGLLDELHQSMVPGRSAEFGDWIADALGTMAGVLLYILVLRTRVMGRGSRSDAAAESTTT